jgi:endonuclease/exonuclease/phosphatase family metal-dependent hydrolase
LQEVGSLAQVQELASRTGMYYTDAHLLTQPGCRGCLGGQAILSRWGLSDIRHLEGDRAGCVFDCGGATAVQAGTVQVPGQPAVRFVNTHLSMRTQQTGAAQAEQIRTQLVNPFPGPVVVGGDFNGNRDLVAPIGPLTDAFAALRPVTAHNPITDRDAIHCGDRDPAQPLDDEDPRIDHILVRGGTSLTYNGVYGKCPANLRLSDHPRVSARIAFPPIRIRG